MNPPAPPALHVLVTGGGGYVGSVVAAQLLAAGHQVVVLDDLSTGHADAVPPGADFVEGSIADPAATDAVFARASIDTVVHCAARSVVAESVRSPELYWANNVGGSLALLEAMRQHEVRRIVFSSTAATYGEPETVPILESASTTPTSTYGASKLAVDHMLTSYAHAYGFSAVSLRYFNVAGALITEQGMLGERHTTETHLIPIALEVAAGIRAELSIYGTSYPTPDGTCIRDYIHVMDLADAHLRALAWTEHHRSEHLICNLGSGRGNSVREVVVAVREVTGAPTPTVDRENRAGDPAVLIASNIRAAEVLGWRPTRDLDQMVADAATFAANRVRNRDVEADHDGDGAKA
ncbi:UDP-glucose 4-epimerase GalE [Jatrophihabitans sp. DSM 45814]